jgi:8-oxo-dGTP pyrophosphatase MutT (NUDIX family)
VPQGYTTLRSILERINPKDNRQMNKRWKPSVTVAAIIEREGRYLLIEEHTPEGLRLNNPAGHLDAGESPQDGCAREALEETTYTFQPTEMVGIYISRLLRPARADRAAEDVTYFRLAFCGELGNQVPDAQLDKGIVRTLWMTPDEIRANVHRLRSPLVLRCMEDHLAGQRFPLSLIYTDPSVLNPTQG